MRSRLVKLKTFFFQPRELRGEFANFSVEVGELLLMLSFGGVERFLLVDEQVGQAFDGSCLPLMELCGMDIVFGSDLADGEFFLE